MKQFVLINNAFIAEKIGRRSFKLQHNGEVIDYSEKRMKELDEETEALLNEAISSLDFKYEVNKEGEEKRIYLRNVSQILKDKIEALDYYYNSIIDHPRRLFDIKKGDKCILYLETNVYSVEIVSASDVKRQYKVTIYKDSDKGATLIIDFIPNQLIIKDNVGVQISQLENISVPSYDEDYTLEQIEEIYNKLNVKFKELVEKCKIEKKQEEEQPEMRNNQFHFISSDVYLSERISRRLSEKPEYTMSTYSVGVDPYSSRVLGLDDPESELEEDDEDYDEIDENEEDLNL